MREYPPGTPASTPAGWDSLNITTSASVPAAPDRVFAALVDPNVLRRVIPGCDELRASGPDSYEARVRIGIAGLKGSYAGRAEIRNRNSPQSLTLAFEGKGAPGFVRGEADVLLADEPSAKSSSTQITCRSSVQVGGVMAAVGSRLIEAAARKLADEFFRRLADDLSRDRATAAP